MKKIIFEAIAGYLAANLNTPELIALYDEVMYIGLYNAQFSTDEEEHAIPKPAIAIDFPSSDGWKSATSNQQVGEMIISVYIAYDTKAESNFFGSPEDKLESMKRLDYLQVVQNLLQGFEMGAGGQMSRINEFQDANYDHVSIDRIDYMTRVEDCLSDPSFEFIEISPEWKIVYKNPTDKPDPDNNGTFILDSYIC